MGDEKMIDYIASLRGQSPELYALWLRSGLYGWFSGEEGRHAFRVFAPYIGGDIRGGPTTIAEELQMLFVGIPGSFDALDEADQESFRKGCCMALAILNFKNERGMLVAYELAMLACMIRATDAHAILNERLRGVPGGKFCNQILDCMSSLT